jgi:hypothetical protein
MTAQNDVTAHDDAFHRFLATFHPRKINIAMFRAAHDCIENVCPEHLRALLMGEDWENQFIAAIRRLVKGGKAKWDVDGSTFSIVGHPSRDDGVGPKYASFSAAIIALGCVVTAGQSIIDMIDQMDLCRDRASDGLREDDGKRALWVSILCTLGYGYDSRGKHDDASNVWTKAMKEDPCWAATSNLGLLYAIHGTTEQEYEQAIFLIGIARGLGTQGELASFDELLDQRQLQYPAADVVLRLRHLQEIVHGPICC